MKVTIRQLEASDQEEFLAAVSRSRVLHGSWVSPPRDQASFARYVARFVPTGNFGFVVLDAKSGELAGAINLTNIIQGSFQSGYLGYFGFTGFEGRGYMKAGLKAVIRKAFREFGLHRLEANIQPSNLSSIALVRSCGFKLEGYSPAYLKVAGRWRDHERWALVRGRRSASIPCAQAGPQQWGSRLCPVPDSLPSTSDLRAS